MNNEKYNVKESIRNQKKCWEDGSPDFAPRDGICWNCQQQIYSPIERKHPVTGNIYYTGITTEDAKKLVTGCPHCNRTYCG